ncbi:LPXTG cell wall anchor domain-containing protein [Salinicoccus sp. Marseille-QA3877]
MNRKRTIPFKKLSLASALSIIAVTHMGNAEANDDVENVNVEKNESVEVVESVEEDKIVEDFVKEPAVEEVPEVGQDPVEADREIVEEIDVNNTMEETAPVVEEEIPKEFEEPVTYPQENDETEVLETEEDVITETNQSDIEKPEKISNEVEEIIKDEVVVNEEPNPDEQVDINNDVLEEAIHIEEPKQENESAEENQPISLEKEVVISKNDEEIELQDQKLTETEDEVQEVNPMMSTASIDVDPPVLVSVTSDKSVYNAGEQIQLRVVAEDETGLDYVTVSFSNTSDVGPRSLSGYEHQISRLENGNFEAIVYADIPERTPNSVYDLSNLFLYEDEFSSSYSSYRDELDLSIEVRNNNTVDVDPPTLVSVTSDKSVYNAGEQIQLRVVAADETGLDYVTVSFSNTSDVGPRSLSGYEHQISRLENGNFEAIVYADIPERTPNSIYDLSNLFLYEDEFSSSYSSYRDELDLSIEVRNNNTVDVDPPTLVSVTSDKSVYNAGEQIQLRVVAADETGLDYVTVSFSNTSDVGPRSLSGYEHQISRLENGNFEAIVYADIPERTPNSIYDLSNLFLYEDEFSSSYSSYRDELDLSIEVRNSLETTPEESENQDEPEINDDLSPDYINEITLYDSETTNVITSVTFVGQTFDDRLFHLVQDINEEHGTEYSVERERLDGRTINRSTVNGVTISRTTSNYSIYLLNNSEVAPPVIERPFIPEHTLYDNNNNVNNELKIVTIVNIEGTELFSAETQSYSTIDDVIRNAMQNIDSEVYYYDSVDVSRGWTSRFSNGSYYIGNFNDIEVLVANRNVEEPETPVEPEDPETPVDPEESETPVEPEEPETPVEPEEPETPVEPEEPETPVEPEEPETPVDPEESETPVEPEEPETPVDPEESETPVDPEEPETPVEPGEPETPVEPEEPETPVEPEEPETPVEPEEPETPVEPEEPETPVEPEEPETPVEPEEPETPVEPEEPETQVEQGESDAPDVIEASELEEEPESTDTSSVTDKIVESEDEILVGVTSASSVSGEKNDGTDQSSNTGYALSEPQESVPFGSSVEPDNEELNTVNLSTDSDETEENSISKESYENVSNEEELPNTGIATNNLTIPAALAAFFGGLLVFKRRRSK